MAFGSFRMERVHSGESSKSVIRPAIAASRSSLATSRRIPVLVMSMSAFSLPYPVLPSSRSFAGRGLVMMSVADRKRSVGPDAGLRRFKSSCTRTRRFGSCQYSREPGLSKIVVDAHGESLQEFEDAQFDASDYGSFVRTHRGDLEVTLWTPDHSPLSAPCAESGSTARARSSPRDDSKDDDHAPHSSSRCGRVLHQ